jgi:hypothetical protein
MASIDGVKLSDEVIDEHFNRIPPIFEIDLNQIIYYMGDGKVCSAPVLSRMLVENLHDDWTSNPEQKKAFVPFGPSGAYYNTCHGMWREDEVFATKKGLLESL